MDEKCILDMTKEERHALWRREAEEYEAKFKDRKAADHHTRCRDCGVFLKKSRWIKIDAFNAIKRQQRPLCSSCWSEYD